jgi:hypothetical protein
MVWLETELEILSTNICPLARIVMCLTLEFFTVGLMKKKVYHSGISILSILLNLESGCHNPHPPLRRSMSPSPNPKLGTSPLSHVHTFITDICILYIKLVAYVPYRVPPRGPTHHAYVSISLTRETMMIGFDTIYNTSSTLS